MDKDQLEALKLEILNRQDKYNSRTFILSCVLAVLLLLSIINNNVIVDRMAKSFEATVTEMVRLDADKEKEQTRLYFETDYPYADYDNSVTQEVEVNN